MWQEIPAHEDGADHQEPGKQPLELRSDGAPHPTLQLRHIRDTCSQSAGVPHLRTGESRKAPYPGSYSSLRRAFLSGPAVLSQGSLAFSPLSRPPIQSPGLLQDLLA